MNEPDWVIGRQRELALLRDALASASGGVLVAGRSGEGKTRMVLEGEKVARSLGRRVVSIHAVPGAAGFPLGAFTPLLGGADSEPIEQRLRLVFNALTTDRSTPVLSVDDMHYLDALSAALVHQLVSSGSVTLIGSICTDDDVLPEITSLWKDQYLCRVDLRPFTVEQTAAFLQAQLSGMVDPAFAVAMWERTTGNALYLRELVMHANETDKLVKSDGVWQMSGRIELGTRLTEIVDAKIGALSAGEELAMEALATSGPMWLDDLSALAGEYAVDSVQQRRLVAVSQNLVTAAHPIYSEAIASRMPVGRHRRLTERLAAQLEESGRRDPDARLKRAIFHSTMGDSWNPGDYLESAVIALERHDFQLASDLAQLASEGGLQVSGDLLRARALGMLGDVSQADAILDRLADLSDNDGDRVAVAIARIDRLAFHESQVSKAMSIAEALAQEVSDPALLTPLELRRAGFLMNAVGPKAAFEAVEPLLALTLTPEDRNWALMLAAWCLARMGRLFDAIKCVEIGQSLAEEQPAGTEWPSWLHDVNECFILAELGKFDEAIALAETRRSASLESHELDARGWFTAFIALTVAERGHASAAFASACEAVVVYRQLGRLTYLRDALVSTVLSAAVSGRKAQAEKGISELESLGSGPLYWYFAVDLEHAKGWEALAEQNYARARQLFSSGVQLAIDSGDLIGEVRCLHALARMGDAEAVVERMTELASLVDGDFSTARLEHARALATSDSQGLEAAARTFEALGAGLLACESYLDSSKTWAARGDKRTAARLRRIGLAMIGPDRNSPNVLARMGGVEELTAGEYETASLAASGASNRSIAHTLQLSIRTVENRLQRVYSKLGIGTRTELREVLIQQ